MAPVPPYSLGVSRRPYGGTGAYRTTSGSIEPFREEWFFGSSRGRQHFQGKAAVGVGLWGSVTVTVIR